MGHSGTLDPGATGVLLLGVGRVARLLRFLTALGKTYTCEIVLGVETDTLDDSGTVVATHDMTAVSPEQVIAAVAELTGDILQVPPMVSAVKVDGRRLHELARAGEVVEREARPVTVHRFAVSATADPCVYTATSPARRAPTSGRWPPIWAPPWAAVPTCGRCVAPPWAPSARTTPTRWSSRPC
ncbi:MAG: hypothetical protein R2690_18805 [Acidimicrobiales bacterium]